MLKILQSTRLYQVSSLIFIPLLFVTCSYSTIVINALSDKYHPLQTLADLMTLKEHFNNQLQGKTVAWIGDGNNVLHDLLIGSLKVGMNVNIATPKDYRPDPDVLEEAFQIAKASNLKVNVTDDPKVAIKGANVVVTDTWISMGQEAEAKKRKLDFTGYQIDTSLMKLASSDAVFLHCLPKKQEEVTDEVGEFYYLTIFVSFRNSSFSFFHRCFIQSNH